MNGRSFLLLGSLLALPLVSGPCLAAGPLFVPLPYVLKAKAVVDGAQLTGVDPAYSIKVKSIDGTEFQPVDAQGSAFGKVTPSRFQYNIPTYGAHDQPGGAKAGQKACVEVYHGATRLNVTYPDRGSCPAGSGEIMVLSPGDAVGFGINGRPNDGSHSFPAVAATTPGVPGRATADPRAASPVPEK
ncbi:MAG: hypothetical protein ABSC19_10265 [Syntrophorhabdales bacterium]|jgi:hypothetical protein